MILGRKPGAFHGILEGITYHKLLGQEPGASLSKGVTYHDRFAGRNSRVFLGVLEDITYPDNLLGRKSGVSLRVLEGISNVVLSDT